MAQPRTGKALQRVFKIAQNIIGTHPWSEMSAQCRKDTKRRHPPQPHYVHTVGIQVNTFISKKDVAQWTQTHFVSDKTLVFGNIKILYLSPLVIWIIYLSFHLITLTISTGRKISLWLSLSFWRSAALGMIALSSIWSTTIMTDHDHDKNTAIAFTWIDI